MFVVKYTSLKNEVLYLFVWFWVSDHFAVHLIVSLRSIESAYEYGKKSIHTSENIQ